MKMVMIKKWIWQRILVAIWGIGMIAPCYLQAAMSTEKDKWHQTRLTSPVAHFPFSGALTEVVSELHATGVNVGIHADHIDLNESSELKFSKDFSQWLKGDAAVEFYHLSRKTSTF